MPNGKHGSAQSATSQLLRPYNRRPGGTNARNDAVKKLRVYHRCQVPHYWIIDPLAETLTVHRFTDGGYLLILATERGERVRAEPFEAIALQVGVLFGDDEEDV